jgi:hypothetical protein
MAVYTTVFVAPAAELPAGFCGWKPPLNEPRQRTFLNPYTQEEVTAVTDEPDWPDDSDEFDDPPHYEVVEIHGDYHTYLDQRIPPFVAARPHWCTKGLTDLELEALLAAITGTSNPFPNALYAPPSLSSVLLRLPDALIVELRGADEGRLLELARTWATAMSQPEHTHSVSGHRLNDGWSVDDALLPLQKLAELVKSQRHGESLYLLVEA